MHLSVGRLGQLPRHLGKTVLQEPVIRFCQYSQRRTISDSWRPDSRAEAKAETQRLIAGEDGSIDAKVGVSKAMRAYLERAQAHNLFMKQQAHDFQIGRRHLANMMGEDPETFTQDDINRSIAYLLPSNLFSKKTRPFMKPPEEVFPQQKEAQFGLDGRPFHPFFYTGLPNFYQAMHDANEWMRQLNELEDERVRKGKTPPPGKKLTLAGTKWLTKEELETMMLEKLHDRWYQMFMTSMERLLLHPYVYRAEEFILKFRSKLLEVKAELQIPELKKDEAGRLYAEVYANKKSSHAWVTLKEGTGNIDINGQDIRYFERTQDRQQIMFPMQFLCKLFKFDLTAKVEMGGTSSQSGAIREAMSKCLAAFVGTEELENLRQAGLLTHDKRVKERKKYAYMGARKKPKWRKR